MKHTALPCVSETAPRTPPTIHSRLLKQHADHEPLGYTAVGFEPGAHGRSPWAICLPCPGATQRQRPRYTSAVTLLSN